jgi:hypothetical protein
MKKVGLILFLITAISFFSINSVYSQCSICTKTAMQQGEKAAGGMNSGVIYLMLAPFAVVGFVGYRWYKNQGGPIEE